jgi:hypothetical protein
MQRHAEPVKGRRGLALSQGGRGTDLFQLDHLTQRRHQVHSAAWLEMRQQRQSGADARLQLAARQEGVVPAWSRGPVPHVGVGVARGRPPRRPRCLPPGVTAPAPTSQRSWLAACCCLLAETEREEKQGGASQPAGQQRSQPSSPHEEQQKIGEQTVWSTNSFLGHHKQLVDAPRKGNTSYVPKLQRVCAPTSSKVMVICTLSACDTIFLAVAVTASYWAGDHTMRRLPQWLL